VAANSLVLLRVKPNLVFLNLIIYPLKLRAMKAQDLYFKSLQNSELQIYDYARLIRSVNPPLGEIINLLNPIPIIDMEDYHQKDFRNWVK
jgi:hypothetical protein